MWDIEGKIPEYLELTINVGLSGDPAIARTPLNPEVIERLVQQSFARSTGVYGLFPELSTEAEVLIAGKII